MEYNAIREAALEKIGNHYELVTIIQNRVRELEDHRKEGVPKKGTELIQYVMQEILDDKLIVNEKEDLREASAQPEG